MKSVSCSLTTLGVLATASLVGCGTMPSPSTQALSTDVDDAQINAINNVARSRGVQIVWINYPRKVVRPAAANPASPS